MRPKVLVTREVFPEVLERLEARLEVASNQGDVPLRPPELADALADRDGALATPGDRTGASLLARCPRLRAVCNIAVGYDNIDVEACRKRGIAVTHTPGVLDDATADFTFALLLAAARRVTEAEAWLRAGEWRGWKLEQLLGQPVHRATLGIVGMGRIGQAVARRARGFEMRILYHNRRRLELEVERALGAEPRSLDALLRESDFVALHLPYSPETHHRIGAAELA